MGLPLSVCRSRFCRDPSLYTSVPLLGRYQARGWIKTEATLVRAPSEILTRGSRYIFLNFAHHGKGRFDGDRARFDKVDLHQRIKFAIPVACLVPSVFQAGCREFRHHSRCFVRGNGNDPMTPERDDRQSQRIISGEHSEACGRPRADLPDLRNVAAGFLDSGDVRDLRQPKQCIGQYVRSRFCRERCRQ